MTDPTESISMKKNLLVIDYELSIIIFKYTTKLKYQN